MLRVVFRKLNHFTTGNNFDLRIGNVKNEKYENKLYKRNQYYFMRNYCLQFPYEIEYRRFPYQKKLIPSLAVYVLYSMT